ncbi:MAG: hypothetical protein L0Z48_02855 [candidate division Zixibacteria bacterium]|nr:hypothetical protein [candidate division Zixibacteria bacterium]MCI0595463.1 hypothetical protein [candidate division Zixibacteria bacterium]
MQAPSPSFVNSVPRLTEKELLSLFSSPIQLGPEETDLYNPEDLAALLFFKPSIDIFSFGSFGQKRGFSNWGRIGKGEEILYNGQTRAPIYLNYPQSSEVDLTPLQFEQADSVFFFDHPLASFLFGAQAPASIYLHSSSANVKQPFVSARLNKKTSNGSPFSSSRHTTAVFDLRRPLGNKAFVRGIGSFKNNDTTGINDKTEVQSHHLSLENPAGSKNRWRGGYELDRELGDTVSFTGITDSNLGKNFRRDAFFFRMDGRLSANSKIEADLRYQRTDQKILSTDSTVRRRVEERRPFFGLALNREASRSFAKFYANVSAVTLNQHPGRADDWQIRLGGVWATKLDDKTVFSGIGQLSETRLESPKPEGWVGLARMLGAHQTVFVTASSQVIYPSLFDHFFEPKTSGTYAELSNSGPPERSNRLNFTYKIETRRFTGGFSIVAERSDNYLVWENPALVGSANTWRPSFKDVEGGGGETDIELKALGEWKGGYALKGIRDRKTKFRLPLTPRHRAYLRWTTPGVRPIKAISFRLVPTVHFYSGFINDIIPYEEREATLVNLKAIGAVKNFNFFYSVENLVDRQYFLRGSMPQPGRSWFFGFNWSLWD